MPKNPNIADYTILLSVIGGLLSICGFLSVRVLNHINSYVKKHYSELRDLTKELAELGKDFEHLRGQCEERHKK